MKMLIEIPDDQYDRFLAACDKRSPEYVTLKNGCITRVQDGGLERRTVQILCDDEQASKLVEAANQLCPEVAPVIAERRIPVQPRGS
jgi:hypothetical protein